MDNKAIQEADTRLALELARHELTRLHNLWATDRLDKVQEIHRQSLDEETTKKLLEEVSWVIDTQEAVKAINKALENRPPTVVHTPGGGYPFKRRV